MNIFDIKTMITEKLEKTNRKNRLEERVGRQNILEAISQAKKLVLLENESEEEGQEILGIFAEPEEDLNLGFGGEEDNLDEVSFDEGKGAGFYGPLNKDLNMGFSEADEKLDEEDLDAIACSRRANELAGTEK